MKSVAKITLNAIKKGLSGLFLVVMITLIPLKSYGWGNEGHEITALLASMLLTDRARQNMAVVMEGERIEKMSTWPDKLKRANDGCLTGKEPVCNPDYRPETAQWHFVDIPFEQDKYDPKGPECLPTRYGDCIIPAITDFYKLLLSSDKVAFAKRSDEQKRKFHDALSFIIHLLGDIHQPLHCAEHQNDGGGNNVLVTWPGEPPYPFKPNIWNLHAVWDDYLVDKNINTMQEPANRNSFGYARYLFNEIVKAHPEEKNFAQRKSNGIINGQPENPTAWAESSHSLAKLFAYKLPPETTTKIVNGQSFKVIKLNEKYFTDNMPGVEKQLRLGGVRLANILNNIYDRDFPQN